MHYRAQQEAIERALSLVRRLPASLVWSLCVTNADDNESPSVLNIFTPDEERWDEIRCALLLGGPPTDINETFLSFRYGTLLVSLILEDPS